MSKSVTTTELRKMSAEDLKKEIAEQNTTLTRKRLNVKMRTEKDTASYRRDKKMLARMLTIMNEMNKTPSAQPLKAKGKTSKVPASAKATAGKPAPNNR